jgi:hypothetical protein
LIFKHGVLPCKTPTKAMETAASMPQNQPFTIKSPKVCHFDPNSGFKHEFSYLNKEPSYLGSEPTLKKLEIVIIKYGIEHFLIKGFGNTPLYAHIQRRPILGQKYFFDLYCIKKIYCKNKI